MYQALKAISHTSALLSLAAFLLASSASAEANWPSFRGGEARGIGWGEALPVRWSATENVEWKTDIPGRGWSSLIVWGDRVFLTTAVSLGDPEKPKKGLYFGGERPTPDSVYQWKVYCLDLETGRILWDTQVHEGKPAGGRHLKNSFASETPVTDGEHVYAYFGYLGMYCLDFDGNIVWEKKLGAHAMRNNWGTAASPALHEDRVYIVNDNDEDSYLLALDKRSGEEIWRTARDEKSNWATPYVWANGQRTEIVTPGTGKVRSYDLDGKLLWTLEGMSSITIATPYEWAGLLFLSSGYVGDREHRPIYAIRPGAEGNISLVEDETRNQYIVWSQPIAAPYNPSTIVYEDLLYVLYDRGFLSCYSARDGTEIYERERIPDGRRFSASPWANDGKIFCLNEDGVTFVFNAGNEFELLHSNPLADDDMGMATPAIAGDRLLIRTSARLYSIRDTGGDRRESE